MRPVVTAPGAMTRAFTLIEVLIAVGIASTAILAIIALLIPARTASRDATLITAAAGVGPVVERQLQEDSFADRFTEIADEGELWLTHYQIRVHPDADPDDPPATSLVTSATGTVGGDYVLATIVTKIDDPRIATDFAALEGSIFVLRLTAADPALQAAPVTGSASAFPGAAVFLDADFHLAPAGVPADWPERLAGRRPLISIPLTLRR